MVQKKKVTTTKKVENKVKKTKASNGGDNVEFLKMIGGDMYKGDKVRKKDFTFDIMRTKFTSVNRATGAGGILTGGIWEVFGLNHGGKSAFAIGLLGDAQEQGHLTMFADGERSDNDDRWTNALGWDKTRGLYFRPSSFENCRAEVNKAINRFRENQQKGKIPKDKKFVVLVDSVPTLVPKEFFKDNADEKEDNTAKFGKIANLMSEWLPVLLTKVGDDDDKPSNVTVIFINQMRQNIGAGLYEEKFKTFGGEALKFYAQVRAEVRKTGDVKKTIKGVEKKVGKEHKVIFRKCKIGVGEEAKFYTSNGKGDAPLGFDIFKEVITEASYRKVMEKSGKKIVCDMFDWEFGDEKAARKFLTENPEEFQKLIDYLNDNITEVKATEDDEGDDE